MLHPHVELQVNPTIDARLIATNTIIHYSTVELEQAISRELDENPALELMARATCPFCALPFSGTHCARCQMDVVTGPPPEPFVGDVSAGSLLNAEDPLDIFSTVATPQTLAGYLLDQLRLILNEQEQEVALHLVGTLDEHGYVTVSPEELARTLQVEVSLIDRVLQELQHLDPPGIGARTVEECLLLQLEELEDQGVEIPEGTRDIIKEHLKNLGSYRFERICQALCLSREKVEEIFLFIRANLHPYPANQYCEVDEHAQVANRPVRPSILIHQDGMEYRVEVIEPHLLSVCINPLYQQVRQTPQQNISVKEREHVVHYLDRARFFMSALQRRHIVLQQLASYLVSAQREFLIHGPSHLRPLTQTTVARALGIHPSTVSRAVAGKYVQLPSHTLFPLQGFFASENQAQECVRQMILHETQPLSDAQIVRRLQSEQQIVVSRQMVANYRASLKIPPVRQRSLLLLQRKWSSA